MLERGAGILLPIFSLPSPYGIGSLGAEAYRFADFLAAAGQRYWQILPLGVTAFGDSPYQSLSSFAGNPYFIDLDLLVSDGLLTADELPPARLGARYANYEQLRAERLPLPRKAKERGWARDAEKVAAFCRENGTWLADYALFMALRRHFGEKPWYEWPDEGAKHREAAALDRFRVLLREDIEFYIYEQYLFSCQWDTLHSYCKSKGIRIIGDIPIYVAPDCADVWAEPQQFRLDAAGRCTEVAGVPPDYFSAEGQLWGNPLYDYDAMQRDGYSWWIRRIGGMQRLYDVIRIDHFRGFSDYWAVPADAETAAEGHWVAGPGYPLIRVLTQWFCGLDFIAEDLGAPTPALSRLLQQSGLPGMKVLEFAFDDPDFTEYLPHTYGENCICYSGTHDNAPLALWMQETSADTLARAAQYFGVDRSALPEAMLRGGMMSRAVLFIAQMQDYLALGEGHRTNVPGTPRGNWCWRMLPGEADAALAAQLRTLAAECKR